MPKIVRDLEESPLCCCEYINLKGQRSHLLAFCCECDALDDTIDTLTKRKGVSQHQIATLLEQIADRIRIPTFGGAMKLKTELTIPFLTVFSILLFGSYSLLTTVIAMVALQTIVTSFLIKVISEKKPSNFFVSWAVTGSLLEYVCYMHYKALNMCPDLFESIALNLIFAAFWGCFIICRGDPGVVGKVSDNNFGRTDEQPAAPDSTGEEYFDLTVPLMRELPGGGVVALDEIPQKYVSLEGERQLNIRLPRGYEVTLDLTENEVFPPPSVRSDRGSVWCKRCEFWVPPRTVHCRTCQHCVVRLDHHCVWLNTCVGWNNQRSFVGVMLLFIVGTVWGSVSTLQCVCYNPVNTVTDAPTYPCWDIYTSFSTSFPFVCALYAVLLSMFISILLARHLLLVSFGTTWAEFSRTWAKHKSLAPAVRDTLKKNRNSFGRNWLNFIAKTAPIDHTCPPSHVV